MLTKELHWSFVLSVVATYGISQGLGGGIVRVASDYYWKDVQKVQPSAAQVYHGVTSIPWMVKPIWGLLTDVLPVAGYRRRKRDNLKADSAISPCVLAALQAEASTASSMLSSGLERISTRRRLHKSKIRKKNKGDGKRRGENGRRSILPVRRLTSGRRAAGDVDVTVPSSSPRRSRPRVTASPPPPRVVRS